MKVEFLLAFDDNTWSTHEEDIPAEELSSTSEGDSDLILWANKNLAGQTRFRHVVLFAVYSIGSE